MVVINRLDFMSRNVIYLATVLAFLQRCEVEIFHIAVLKQKKNNSSDTGLAWSVLLSNKEAIMLY